jgi:hypothetical protein
MHSHNHHLASVPGDNAGHPFDLNDPPEEDQENMHACDHFPHVQAMFATIIINVESFNNQFTDNQHTTYNIFL